MSYISRFTSTDNLILHLDPYILSLTDYAIKANYAGFLSVSAVTVFELSIKEIFCDFASKKNIVFGSFVDKHFNQINGKIKLDDLKNTHIKAFGSKYFEKFETKLKIKEREVFRTYGKNLRSEYTNLIICRHKFVHVGSPTLTYEEVVQGYRLGKEVINSLYEAMKR